ncbi:putative metal-binding motif-containing protein [Candidatus Pacearchaeota archaeon]|nr:putative metal-binding motif-containing protein [Candidatus Pacearchaeota archaeon]
MKRGIIIVSLVLVFLSLNLALGIKYFTPSCGYSSTNQQECEQYFTNVNNANNQIEKRNCQWNNVQVKCNKYNIAGGSPCSSVDMLVANQAGIQLDFNLKEDYCKEAYELTSGKRYNCVWNGQQCLSSGAECQLSCTASSAICQNCNENDISPIPCGKNITATTCSVENCIGNYQLENPQILGSPFKECIPEIAAQCGYESNWWGPCVKCQAGGRSFLTNSVAENRPGCTTYYYDQDGDNHGTNPPVSTPPSPQSRCLCSAQDLYRATNLGDCQDSNNLVWNLRGNIFIDSDRDGAGIGTSISMCFPETLPAGYSSVGGDCDDNNANIKPEDTETNCNDGIDNNCKNGADCADETCGAKSCNINNQQGFCFNSMCVTPFSLYLDVDRDDLLSRRINYDEYTKKTNLKGFNEQYLIVDPNAQLQVLAFYYGYFTSASSNINTNREFQLKIERTDNPTLKGEINCKKYAQDSEKIMYKCMTDTKNDFLDLQKTGAIKSSRGKLIRIKATPKVNNKESETIMTRESTDIAVANNVHYFVRVNQQEWGNAKQQYETYVRTDEKVNLDVASSSKDIWIDWKTDININDYIIKSPKPPITPASGRGWGGVCGSDSDCRQDVIRTTDTTSPWYNTKLACVRDDSTLGRYRCCWRGQILKYESSAGNYECFDSSSPNDNSALHDLWLNTILAAETPPTPDKQPCNLVMGFIEQDIYGKFLTNTNTKLSNQLDLSKDTFTAVSDDIVDKLYNCQNNAADFLEKQLSAQGRDIGYVSSYILLFGFLNRRNPRDAANFVGWVFSIPARALKSLIHLGNMATGGAVESVIEFVFDSLSDLKKFLLGAYKKEISWIGSPFSVIRAETSSIAPEYTPYRDDEYAFSKAMSSYNRFCSTQSLIEYEQAVQLASTKCNCKYDGLLAQGATGGDCRSIVTKPHPQDSNCVNIVGGFPECCYDTILTRIKRLAISASSNVIPIPYAGTPIAFLANNVLLTDYLTNRAQGKCGTEAMCPGWPKEYIETIEKNENSVCVIQDYSPKPFIQNFHHSGFPDTTYQDKYMWGTA